MPDILIYKDLHKYGEYDLMSCASYDGLIDCIDRYYAGVCPNYGNKLWLNGIITALQEDNNLTFWNASMDPDFINSNFDSIVLPMANIFYVGYISAIERYTDIFKQIRIPTYVIACGVQADSYDDLDLLLNQIGNTAKRFIRAIYNTGGEFALRGYFTEEFFHKLGFNTAVVTGCPSLYARGKNLRVYKREITEEELNPVLNGRLENKYGATKFLREYPGAYYIDQCDYFDMLYRTNTDLSREQLIRLLRVYIQKYGFTAVELAVHDRIKLFFDIPVWEKFLADNKINFSYGSRIHGNIMPILCGIPSVVCVVDSRTREMAEFYHIPTVDSNAAKDTLYMIYCSCNYQAFNEHFSEKYEDFRAFLFKYGLVKSMENISVHKADAICKESKALSERNDMTELYDLFDKYRWYFKLDYQISKNCTKIKSALKNR